MDSTIYIDPEINIKSEKTVKIIIQFKTKPTKAAVALSKGKLTLDEAKQQVNATHSQFQEELTDFLDQKQIPYFISQIHKDVFNGVSMQLQGHRVNLLLQSKVIESIYADGKLGLPKRPFNQMYQI